MYLITVLPLSKKARTDVLTYFHAADIPIGTLVEVPFRSKSMRALVMTSAPAQDMKGQIKEASYQIRKVTKVLSDVSFAPELIIACKEVADFYLEPLSKVIDEVVPDAVFESETKIIPRQKKLSETPSLLSTDLADRLSWYKTRIRELFSQKKSLYFVFPTEREAKTMHAALSRGIEEHSVLITSGLAKKKFSAALEKIEKTEHALCIFGTASYLALTRNDLDTVIIEHESAPSYRRVTAPFIDMRFFVEIYAKKMGYSLVLADTLARVETYERYKKGELSNDFPFTFHPNLPEQEEVIARTKDGLRGTFKIITPELEAAILHAEKTGSRIFLFTLRNGLASVTSCRDCGETLVCEYCQAPLVLYKNDDKRIFICNACKRHTPSASACKRCGSWNLFPYGIGIESVYEECKTQFPNMPLFRIDRASLESDKAAHKVAEDFAKTPGSILVGTELALHYLSEKVPSTGIVSFDSLFSIPSFRVTERIVELITTLREKTEEKLLIQTMYPDDRLLKITSKPRLVAWYEEELLERQEFNYPPHSTLIKIVGHVSKARSGKIHEELEGILSAWSPDIYTSASREKKDYVRIIALIRVPKLAWWFSSLDKKSAEMANLRPILSELKETYAILVNPEDLL